MNSNLYCPHSFPWLLVEVPAPIYLSFIFHLQILFKIRTQWVKWSLPIWTWCGLCTKAWPTCQGPPHREEELFFSQKPIQLHLVGRPRDPFYIFLRPIISQNLDSPHQLGFLANESLESVCPPPLCASPPFWGELHFITQASTKVVSTPPWLLKLG